MKTTFSNKAAMNGLNNDKKLMTSPSTTNKTNKAIIAIDKGDTTNPLTAKYLTVNRILPVTAGDDPLSSLSDKKYIVRLD